MRYIVGGESFTKINIANGTIQNASKINIVEVSNTTVEGSGVLLAPFEKFLFAGEGDLYARCADGAGAEVLTVPFEVDKKGGGATIIDGTLIVGSASSTLDGALWIEMED